MQAQAQASGALARPPCPPTAPHVRAHLTPRPARCEVVERRAAHDLAKARARLHLVDGFLAAMRDLDAVVQVRGGWRRCPGRVHARGGLLQALLLAVSAAPARRADGWRRPARTCAGSKPAPFWPPALSALLPRPQTIRQAPDGGAAMAALQAPPYGLSREQAEGVLGLTLRRLTSLEAAKLQEEQRQLQEK